MAGSDIPPEMQLEMSEVLGHMPGGFFVYYSDGDEDLIYSNEACWGIFGCATFEEFEELTGNTFPGLVHPDDIERVEAEIAEQIERDEHDMDYVEYRIICKNGEVRYVQDYGHLARREGRDLFYVFINDATDRMMERMDELEGLNQRLRESYKQEVLHRRVLRNALAEAEAANVAKNAFLSNMSHDIRTPLNAVTGYASLIENHKDDPDKIDTYTKRINEAARQLLSVVNETLEISRIESANVQLEEVETDLVEVLTQLVMDSQPAAHENSITLDFDLSGIENRFVMADAVRLSQVFQQLIDNAIKYSGEGCAVNFSAKEVAKLAGGYTRYQFNVKDNGVGMSQDFIDRMFEPFERANNTTEGGVQGTGLGLTIVRHILNLMEGTITVESTPGEGTEFVVTMSLRESASEDDGSVAVARPITSLQHVLLVEDNMLNREIAYCMLTDAGYDVSTAENGKIALDMIVENTADTYDLVLMDIQMPVMNGYETTRAIRSLDDPLRASIPIVAVSANAFSEDRKRSIESGMNAHIAKPFDLQRLENLLDTMIS